MAVVSTLFGVINHDFVQLHLNHVLRCRLENVEGIGCF